MSNDIVLIYPKNTAINVSNTPPLGPLYLVSYLREKNINVEFYDFEIIDNWENNLIEIMENNPKNIGLTCNVANYDNTLIYAQMFKRYDKNINIIVGGPLPSCIPEKFIKFDCIDVVFVGESEEILYNYLKNGKNTRGLYLKNENGFFFTGDAPLIDNLDKLPFPALDLIDLSNYNTTFKKKQPISSIITSRGCPFKCGFCSHSVSGFKWRARSPKNVIRELKWQVNELGAKEIWFWDDNFTFNIDRTREICEAIIKENLEFVWQCPNGIRVDNIDLETLKIMKKAGCWLIALAPETGDPSVFRKINKKYSLEQVEKVASWCKEIGMVFKLFIIIGFPFDNERTIRNNEQFIKKISPDALSVHIYTPFPDTSIYQDFDLKTNLNTSYHSSKSTSNYYQKIFKKMTLKFYLNPKNIFNLFNKLGIKNILYIYREYFKVFLNSI